MVATSKCGRVASMSRMAVFISRPHCASAVMPGEVRAVRRDGTFVAARLRLADLLAVAFEQEEGALARRERLRGVAGDRLLRLLIIDAVVLALAPAEESHQNVRAVRRDGRERSDTGEEEDSVDA